MMGNSPRVLPSGKPGAVQSVGRQIEKRVQRLTCELGTLNHSALAIDGNNLEYLFAYVDPIGEGFRQCFGSHSSSPFDLRCSNTAIGVRGGPSH
jgi:hypothetical protein